MKMKGTATLCTDTEDEGNGSADDTTDGCLHLNMSAETTFAPNFFITFGSILQTQAQTGPEPMNADVLYDLS